MEAQHRAHEDEEGRELDEHGARLDQPRVPQDRRDGQAPHRRHARQELRGVDPPAKRKKNEMPCLVTNLYCEIANAYGWVYPK